MPKPITPGKPVTPAPPDELPAAAQLGQLRSGLARLGTPPAVANAICGIGKTRRQIAADTIAWQRTLPKG